MVFNRAGAQQGAPVQQLVWASRPARRDIQDIRARGLLLRGERGEAQLITGEDAQPPGRGPDRGERRIACPAFVGLAVAESVVQLLLAVKAAPRAGVVEQDDGVVRQAVRPLVQTGGEPEPVLPGDAAERGDKRAVQRLSGPDIERLLAYLRLVTGELTADDAQIKAMIAQGVIC